MKTNKTLSVVAVAAAATLLSAGAYAQAMQLKHPHPLPHPVMTHKPGPAPKVPSHGPHSFASHGKAAYLAVQEHAKTSCEHLAHHFVGTVAHAQFYSECMNTHIGVMTHIRPHPDAAKG
jgi:hypothetical protein